MPAHRGIYLQMVGQPGVPLDIHSLEDRRQGIEVVAVTALTEDDVQVERATVLVPPGKLKHFINRFDSYARNKAKTKGERRYENMIDRIATIRLASLRALWTDRQEDYPGEDAIIWWEVWIRRSNGLELRRFSDFALAHELELSSRRLEFDDRIVVMTRATARQLSRSVDVLNDIAEVRLAKGRVSEIVESDAQEQHVLVQQLLSRISSTAEDGPAVCLLDTGVNSGHPLISPVLSASDCHACNPDWGTFDHEGHGTKMAGLAAYGDLRDVLNSSAEVVLEHGLESVKILPPHGANEPELFGAITAEATARVELAKPNRKRLFSMSITAPELGESGQPTSWSAAIDALAAGRAFDAHTQGLVYLDDIHAQERLYVLSAGNVRSGLCSEHLDRCDVEMVEDPAQAWNAITVGASTELTTVTDPDWSDWSAVAKAGELSPWSRTSLTFQEGWPIKPDVVFEGGNIVANDHGDVDFPVPDLCLLSTHFEPTKKPFELVWATSAATAQVSRMAAQISVDYPEFWPQTIRGLIVHSAEWTRKMKSHLIGASSKTDRARLSRRYGLGVPSLDRALRSASDALTLVYQGTIRPFDEGKIREMHVHDLPWPREVLESLGEESCRLRVTLSYFVEPNPGRRGWSRRHRYASHGLRFELKKPTESLDDFRKRINVQALDEEERRPRTESDSEEWFLGQIARNRGSIHSDYWVGTAADLAQRGIIGVFPVSGWWKEMPKRDRSSLGSRYALVVSIETDAEDVDIWTPVETQVSTIIDV